MTKNEISLAQANGVLDKLRRAEIEKRIAKKYTPIQEFRIYVNKDTEPEAWQEHEEFVAEVKAAVDAEISEVTTNEA